MAWSIEYSETAKEQLRKLDKPVAKRIVEFMDDRVAPADDPRRHGRALRGPLGEFWRYRVGNYRVICQIQDEVLRVLVLAIGHRNTIYRSMTRQ
ncbi:type II toxin-antitoxin system RelE family toxin [Tepidiphilus olei]|uniref:type II toxin-antitoxin system RelE family toxin n=1 Tax=Tepidiphilus olei TaxID=2502184 RepID=UPI00115D98F5|nr:type II toxin-antitoxin system RelE/ParE family toxin [Tepidiphilus olei]